MICPMGCVKDDDEMPGMGYVKQVSMQPLRWDSPLVTQNDTLRELTLVTDLTRCPDCGFVALFLPG